MRGLIAQEAEVVGRRNNAAAKVILPQTVGEHTCGDWVLFAGDPFGERTRRLPDPALTGSGGKFFTAQQRGHASLDHFAFKCGIAATEDAGRFGSAPLSTHITSIPAGGMVARRLSSKALLLAA